MNKSLKNQNHNLKSSEIIILKDSEFNNLIKNKSAVLIDFWAEWCEPCKMINPKIEKIAKHYQGQLTVAKLDIDKNPNTAKKLGINCIPTLVLFKDTKESYRITGSESSPKIKKKIKEIFQIEPIKNKQTKARATSKLAILDKTQLEKFRKIAVIGDIHGDLDSLQSALNTVNLDTDAVIFLGDYTDRGPNGEDVIDILNKLKKKYPSSVFCLKGNHEDYPESGIPTWGPNDFREEEIGERWPSYFKNNFEPFIQSLPIALLIPDEILFVHGGISQKIGYIEDLGNPDAEVEEDILWSDPTENKGEYSNSRGLGVVFGPDVSRNFCQRLGVKRIIRSHQPNLVGENGGPFGMHEGRVITTSTTTAYPLVDKAYVLMINPGDFSIKALELGADLLVDLQSLP